MSSYSDREVDHLIGLCHSLQTRVRRLEDNVNSLHRLVSAEMSRKDQPVKRSRCASWTACLRRWTSL